jgi:hypothetical protein
VRHFRAARGPFALQSSLGSPTEEATGVETVRLQKIQQPSRVQRLLQAFISRSDIVPSDSYEISDAKDLPEPLRKVRTRASRQGRVWSCWASRSHVWLFTCDMSLARSRERGVPVLEVSVHDENGELTDSGSWMIDSHGNWMRCGD